MPQPISTVQVSMTSTKNKSVAMDKKWKYGILLMIRTLNASTNVVLLPQNMVLDVVSCLKKDIVPTLLKER